MIIHNLKAFNILCFQCLGTQPRVRSRGDNDTWYSLSNWSSFRWPRNQQLPPVMEADNILHRKLWTKHPKTLTVFWDIAKCSLTEVDERFRGPYCLHHQVRQLLRGYMVLYPRRLSSSYSPLWEPEVMTQFKFSEIYTSQNRFFECQQKGHNTYYL
jgi:hypothetical protein